ncbi:MAG: hypothetical protein K1X74_06595 [Pirellulales bacterium]|nr:hypothetical protein [Pirellulales bacterium]
MSPLPVITSLQNPRIKQAARLREGRHRQKQRRILIDGRRELDRALDAGIEVVEAFVVDDEDLAPLIERTVRCGADVCQVTPSVFERLAYGSRHEGIVAVALAPARSLEAWGEFPNDRQTVVAVLVGLEKPGNVGAILRTADGAGLSGVIIADGATDLFNPNTIRASLGTVFSLPVAAATGTAVIDWLRQRGIRCLVTRPDADVCYTKARLTGPLALVLGAESTGLPAAWDALAAEAISLPMLGAADSLNVSAAAAVLFYESLRQRTAAEAAGS